MTRKDFRARLSTLQKKLDDVSGVPVQRNETKTPEDQIDLQVARFFVEYIEWELQHRELMENALIVNETMKDESQPAPDPAESAIGPAELGKRFDSYVDLELSGCMELLERVEARRTTRPGGSQEQSAPHTAAPDIRWDQTVFEDGYFRYRGRPVFTGGFNMLIQPMVDASVHPELAVREERDIRVFTEQMRKLGVGVVGLKLPIAGLMRSDRTVDPDVIHGLGETIRQYGQRGFRVGLLLNWNGDRSALEAVWPGITAHRGHSVNLDIDHPGARDLVREVLAEAMSVLAERNEIAAWDMANEPFFSPDEWSGYTLAKYRAWLDERHGSIDALNDAWKSRFAGFDAIRLPGDRPQAVPSAGEWFDRISFHNLRVAEFFGFVADEIRRYVPDAAIHMKAQDNSSLGPRPAAVTDGIDRELLAPACRLQGVDTRPLPVTEPRMSAGGEVRDSLEIMNYDESHYGFHWLGQSFLYDYLTSLNPSLPIIDLEYHAFSINAIRIPDIKPTHARSTLWLAHLHGLIANNVWYWHRRYGPHPFPADYFKMWLYGSISTQPLLAAEYFQTMRQLNTFSEEVAALATVPSRPVRLLVSMPSYIQNRSHIHALHRAYEGTCFHGLRVGCVTERMLATSGAPDDCRLIVIPDAEYVSAAALEALRRLHQDGMKIVLFGARAPRYDEHGRPHPADTTSFLDDVPRLEYADAPSLSQEFAAIFSDLTASLPILVRLGGREDAFGVLHRHARVDGDHVVLLANVSPGPLTLQLCSAGEAQMGGVDLLSGEAVDGVGIEMQFQGVRLVRIAESP